MVVAGLALVSAFATPAEAKRGSRHKHYAKAQHSKSHHGRARRAAAGAYNPPFAALVVDAKTGKTLYAQNEDAIRHPASLTKVMTLYMLFEKLDRGELKLDSQLQVSAHAASQPPSKLGVRPGGSISVENAIKALVTRSANDIAAAIAENLGGSEPAFARMMTSKARALGMSSTVYVNASGLPDEDQVTTARDLAVLARAVQDNYPQYYGYFATASFRYGNQVIGNHNRLLGRVEGVDGIKTGYTRMSGFNLMTSAKTSGRHIVAVVLGGRTGAIRDRIMASLVEQNLPRAYAGPRIAPAVAEAAPAPTPSPVKALANLFSGGNKSDDAPAQAAVRPVVASASDSSTTTPSAFRWVAPQQRGAHAQTRETAPRVAAQAAREPTETASIEPASASSRLSYAAERSTGSDVKALTRLASQAEDKDEAPSRPKAERVASAPANAKAGTAHAVEAKAPEPKAPEPKAPEPKASEPKASEPKSSIAKKAAKDDEDGTSAAPKAGSWVIQLGATEDEAKAKEILANARNASRLLSQASPFTEKVVRGNSTLWRARFSGFDPNSAQAACKTLKRNGFQCFATRS